MNCSKCGEEIREAAEYRCEKCTEKAQLEELRKARMINPKYAVLAMLKGETIIGVFDGCHYKTRVFWNIDHFEALDRNRIKISVPSDFKGFRIVRKRPMTRIEILQWVQSIESNGWLVNIRLKCDTELQDDWQLPSRYKYDNYEDTQDDIYEYVRAPIMKSGSGVDRSKMIGFFVEEED
jgi:hypothetical protein